jgi:hypothetical protein
MAAPLVNSHLAENAVQHVAGLSMGDVPLGDMKMEGT